MARKTAKKESGSPAGKPATDRARVGVWVERAAFVLLLVVIAARPMVQEVHTAEQQGVQAVLGPIGHVGPGITVVLDTVMLAAFALIAVGSVARRGYRRMGVEWPILLVCAAALFSCTIASNKRIALTAATDWALLLLLAPALYQLLTSFRQARLVICVLLATAGTFAVQCMLQRTSELEETIRLYEQVREQFWQARGVELDAPEVALFERRMQAREVSGFLAHSNVAGGYLAMCALAGIGLAWSKLYGARLPMRHGFGVVAAVITGWIALPITWTGSKGAIVAAIGGVLLAVVLLACKPLRHRPRTTFGLGWGLFALLVIITIAVGTTRGRLPGTSLAFRWDYWNNSAGMIGDHWLRGVGMENFGGNYLRYKPVTSPEQISDPHNILVRSAAEWGLPGAAAMLWLLVAGSRALAWPRRTAAPPPLAEDHPHHQPMNPWLVGALVAGGIVVVRAAAEGFVSAPYFLVSAVTPATTWLLFYALLVMDANRLSGPADDPPAGLSIWLGGAALAFALHNLVSFSWFIAGAGTAFVAIFAVAVFLRNAEPVAVAAEPRAGRGIWRTLPAVSVGVALAAHVAWNLVPVLRTERALTAARSTLANGAGVEAVGTIYSGAVAADALDPVAAAEGARRLAASTTGPPGEATVRLEQALDWVRTAQRRDPVDAGLWRLEAAIADRWLVLTQDAADAGQAVAATRQALRRNPNEPLLYVTLGNRLCRWGAAAPSADAFAEAADAYRRALELDAARPPEEIRRFPPPKVEAIRAKLEACLDQQQSPTP